MSIYILTSQFYWEKSASDISVKVNWDLTRWIIAVRLLCNIIITYIITDEDAFSKYGAPLALKVIGKEYQWFPPGRRFQIISL